MRKKLNLLCALIFLVLIASFFNAFRITMLGFRDGYNTTKTDIENHTYDNQLLSFKPIFLFPTEISAMKDSVTNTVTGERIPVTYTEIGVFSKIDPDKSEKIGASLLPAVTGFLRGILGIAAIVVFIRFVYRINKSEIFDWRNVKRLRRLGIYLCIAYLCKFVTIYMQSVELSKSFAIDGYELDYCAGLSNPDLLLGLLSLVFAEVFAIGLRLKEEQDLTI